MKKTIWALLGALLISSHASAKIVVETITLPDNLGTAVLYTNSKIKKPAHWFDLWLACSGTLQQPEITSEHSTESISALSQEETISKLDEKTFANKPPLSFGKQIRKARKANGESLRTMAKQVNISSSRLSQIENGCYPHPVSSTLKNKLLTYLNLDR